VEYEEPAGVSVQEAIAAHALQSLGQDVHGDVPEEVCDGRYPVGHALGLCLLIAQGDGMALRVVTNEVALGDDATLLRSGFVQQCDQPDARPLPGAIAFAATAALLVCEWTS